MKSRQTLNRTVVQLLMFALLVSQLPRPVFANPQDVIQGDVTITGPPAATPPPGPIVPRGTPEYQSMVMFGLPSGTEALLRDAVTRHRAKEGRTTGDSDYQQALTTLVSDPIARWRFAPYILEVTLDALGERHPSPAQQVFYDHFQAFFGRLQKDGAQQVLYAWYAHTGKGAGGNFAAVAPPPNYQNVTFSTLWETGPSVSDFVAPEVQIPMGARGKNTVATLFGPTVFGEDPRFQGVFSRDWGSSMEGALAGMGFAVGGAAVLAASMASYMTLSTVSATVTLFGPLGAAIGESVTVSSIASISAGGSAGAAGTLALGIAIVAVVLAAGGMKIADVAQTQIFEDKLEAAANGPPPVTDFRGMVNIPPPQQQAGLWYEGCKEGFGGELDWCRKPCQPGYVDDGVTCRRPENLIWKEKRYRGQQPLQCAPGLVNDAGLCYPQCQTGYRGVATRCYANCTAGFRDDGLYCAKPAPYGRGGGYAAWDKWICERDHGKGNCEWWGAIIYPKCKAGFRNEACCICTPLCPAGMADHGVTCLKNFYDRGVGRVIDSCPSGQEKIGALCYPICPAGFEGKLDTCYKKGCPAGYRDDPLSCMRDVHIVVQDSYYRGVGLVNRPKVEEIMETNKAGLLGYLTKMSIGDPADKGYLTLALPDGSTIKVEQEYDLPSDLNVAPGTTQIVLARSARTTATPPAVVTPPVDTIAPVISVPEDRTVECTSPAGADLALPVPAASDDSGVGPAVSGNAPARFSLGSTTVTWTTADAAGNEARAEQRVTVVDTTAPILQVAAKSAECTSAQGAAVELQATASDACSETVRLESNAPEIFPIGVTTVAWVATDAAGNQARTEQMVSVLDTTPPAVEIAPVSVECASAEGAALEVQATASDLCSDSVQLVSDAPGIFPIGSTTVTWTATDGTGNQAAATQAVEVVDSTPPVVEASDLSFECGSVDFGELAASAHASDGCSQEVQLESDTPERFAPGDTPVTWTGTDAAGNQATAVQTVSVVDTKMPQLSCPTSLTLFPDRADGATADFRTAASDVCSGAIAVECSPSSGARLALGRTTPVTCTAADEAGLTAECFFEVRVPAVEDAKRMLGKQVIKLGRTGQLSQEQAKSLQPNVDGLFHSVEAAGGTKETKGRGGRKGRDQRQRGDRKGSGVGGCRPLEGLIKKTSDWLSEGSLSTETGQPLVENARRLQSAMGC